MSEPHEQLTHLVSEAWREVLGIDGIGPDDDFFDLGGDSLTAARLAGLLHTRLGTEVNAVDVLDQPTVSSLAKELERRRADGN
ncbi:acyl carrier protein [Streptomyces sp. NRRL S-813]|uniref:acyl carrier protein n=1 Tax=Streptomyces sp. NRRL S-813 TaxID=1463919 RepID=UPI0004BE85D1|nr:acyl carrier protein [Streptomyces sp. NRRL S-813]